MFVNNLNSSPDIDIQKKQGDLKRELFSNWISSRLEDQQSTKKIIKGMKVNE